MISVNAINIQQSLYLSYLINILSFNQLKFILNGERKGLKNNQSLKRCQIARKIDFIIGKAKSSIIFKKTSHLPSKRAKGSKFKHLSIKKENYWISIKAKSRAWSSIKEKRTLYADYKIFLGRLRQKSQNLHHLRRDCHLMLKGQYLIQNIKKFPLA